MLKTTGPLRHPRTENFLSRLSFNDLKSSAKMENGSATNLAKISEDEEKSTPKAKVSAEKIEKVPKISDRDDPKKSEKVRRVKPADSIEKMRHTKRQLSSDQIRQLKQDMSLPLQTIQLIDNEKQLQQIRRPADKGRKVRMTTGQFLHWTRARPWLLVAPG